MDGIRDSLSGMKKKFKHRLTGRKRKPDGTAVNPDGETNLLPQPEYHAAEGESHGREEDGADVAGERDFLMDQPPQPESVPVRGDNGQGEEVVDVDGGEASQRYSRPHPDVEVTVRSGRSREPEGVDPSPSIPLISHGGKLGST